MAAVLPSIELLERSREIAEEPMMEMGRLALERILAMSAIEIAGEPHRGKEKGEIRHYSTHGGRLVAGGKRIQLEKPRLRTKEGKKVAVLAYETLRRDPATSERVFNRVRRGITLRVARDNIDLAASHVTCN